MTPEELKIQEMRHDLLFVLAHPEQRCKVCSNRDKDCGSCCQPQWCGDEAPALRACGGGKDGV